MSIGGEALLSAVFALSSISGSNATLSHEEIIIQQGPSLPNSFREHVITGACDGHVVQVRLTSLAYAASSRIEITKNGSPAAAEWVNPIQEILDRSAGPALAWLKCEGESSIVIGITGSLLDPADGEEDDYVKLFRVEFG